MADSKITALTAITTVNPATYPLVIVDTSDTSMAGTGTTKKVTTNQLLGSGGTATLASATITGDLTVDTSTLKVDSANNRVGIGTASPGNALHVQSTGDIARFTNGTNSAYLAIDSAGYTLFTGAGQTGNGFYAKATTNAVQLWTNGAQRYDIDSTGVSTWYVGGSTAMTLNATGLGVGTSPTYKLDVAGQVMRLVSPASTAEIFLTDSGTTNGYVRIRGESNALKFVTGNGTSATIDSSGNVGIGVTPSAWSSGIKVLEFGTKGGLAGSGSDVNLIYNAYYDGSNKYRTSDYANNFQISGGQFKWLTAPSGTAGNVITYTQAMTLDASGNLLVGTTSGLYRGQFAVTSGADRSIFAAQVTGASNGLQVQWNHATTTLRVILANIPTSSAGLASGTLWNDAGTIKIV